MFRINNGIRYALILVIILICNMSSHTAYSRVPTVKVSVDQYDTKYDEYFIKYSKLYFGT